MTWYDPGPNEPLATINPTQRWTEFLYRLIGLVTLASIVVVMVR